MRKVYVEIRNAKEKAWFLNNKAKGSYPDHALAVGGEKYPIFEVSLRHCWFHRDGRVTSGGKTIAAWSYIGDREIVPLTKDEIKFFQRFLPLPWGYIQQCQLWPEHWESHGDFFGDPTLNIQGFAGAGVTMFCDFIGVIVEKFKRGRLIIEPIS